MKGRAVMLHRFLLLSGVIGFQTLNAFIFIWGLKIPHRFVSLVIAVFVFFNLALPYLIWLQNGARQAPLWATAGIVRPCFAWEFNWITFFIFIAPAIILIRLAAWITGFNGLVTGLRDVVLVIAGLWAVITVAGLINSVKAPEVTEHEIAIQGLHKEDDGLRIVQLTDPHVGWWNAKEEFCRIGDMIENLKPDLLLITGDMVDHNPDYIYTIGDCLSRVRPRLGSYAIIGNHDVYTGREEVARRMTSLGFRMLRNEVVSLEEKGAGLALAGFDDSGRGWTGKDPWEKNIPPVLRKYFSPLPLIMLAHRPTAFDEVLGLPVALTLCGHTHGGQLRLPFGLPGLADIVFKHPSGLYRRGDQTLFACRGTGTVGWPFRIFCPAEIAVLILRAPK